VTLTAGAGHLLHALGGGLALASQFNPLVALLTAALGAALCGYPGAGRGAWLRMLAAVALGWFVGDGVFILTSAKSLAGIPDVASGAWWVHWLPFVVWVTGSLVIGYLAPALVGGAVGRRVTRGTGWLAAVVVAGTFVITTAGAVGSFS